jgi:hypothetical protein
VTAADTQGEVYCIRQLAVRAQVSEKLHGTLPVQVVPVGQSALVAHTLESSLQTPWQVPMALHCCAVVSQARLQSSSTVHAAPAAAVG